MRNWIIGCLLLTGATAAHASGVAEEAYRLGAGDTISVQIYGEDSLSREARIDDGCQMEFQFIGMVPVCGQTPQELSAELKGLLAAGYLVDPEVMVVVQEYGSQTVEVKGEVKEPGLHVLRGATTLSEAITLAGGPTSGSVIEAVIVTGNKAVTYYLPDLEREGAAVDLESGDVVILKPPMTVNVLGEVKNEGPVAFREGMTATQALGMAGGPTEFAGLGRTFVLRSNGEKVRINLRRVNSGREADIALNPDDKLVVRKSFF